MSTISHSWRSWRKTGTEALLNNSSQLHWLLKSQLHVTCDSANWSIWCYSFIVDYVQRFEFWTRNVVAHSRIFHYQDKQSLENVFFPINFTINRQNPKTKLQSPLHCLWRSAQDRPTNYRELVTVLSTHLLSYNIPV